MSPFLEELLDMNGMPDNAVPVEPGVIDGYRNRLPEIILELWANAGTGTWKGGLFRLCLPEDYRAILELVFDGNNDLSHEDSHVFAHSAFGQILFWSERHWNGWIDLQTGQVECHHLVDPSKKKNPEISAVNVLFEPDADALDMYDSEDKKLYRRAVGKLGPLQEKECFGFAPALSLGGEASLQTLRKYLALEHYSILAQANEFQLVDFLSRPPRVVRPIG